MDSSESASSDGENFAANSRPSYSAAQTEIALIKSSVSSLCFAIKELKSKIKRVSKAGDNRLATPIKIPMAVCEVRMSELFQQVENYNEQLERGNSQESLRWQEQVEMLETFLKKLKDESEEAISRKNLEIENEHSANRQLQDKVDKIQGNLNNLTGTIEILTEKLKAKDAEVDEWKNKYDVLIRKDLEEMNEMEDKLEQLQKEMEINKGQKVAENSEMQHEKTVEKLTKSNNDLKDECRRRKHAMVIIQAEMRSKDDIIENLKQQLQQFKTRQHELSEHRDAFSARKFVNRVKLTAITESPNSSSVANLNKSSNETNSSRQNTQNASEQTLSTIRDDSFSNKLPSAALGWDIFEEEDDEFEHFSSRKVRRADELQRRNNLCLPHLKSSYPLETLLSAAKSSQEVDRSSIPRQSARPVADKTRVNYRHSTPKARTDGQKLSAAASRVQASFKVTAKKSLAFNVEFSPKTKKLCKIGSLQSRK